MDGYRLEGHRAVPVRGGLARFTLQPIDQRRVAETHVAGAYISTVFLGLDHRYDPDGPPLLFETMVFWGPSQDGRDEYQERYTTWEEAELGHQRAVKLVREEETHGEA